MNIVIVCDKKQKKQISELKFREKNYSVLSYIYEVKEDFPQTMAKYMPHILLIFKGFKGEDMLFRELPAVLESLPYLRTVFVYGGIDNDFELLRKELSELKIYDILLESFGDAGFESSLFSMLDTPNNAASLGTAIEKYNARNTVIEQETVRSHIYDDTPVAFGDLSEAEVEQIDEPQEYISANSNILTTVSSIIPYGAGVIQTALELAAVLNHAKESMALFLDDEAYRNLLAFNNAEEKADGCTLNKLSIYPLSAFDDKHKRRHRFDIAGIINRSELSDREKLIFAQSDIKIQLCSGTEWDTAYLEEYLNSDLPYLKEINYCFYPISQKQFIRFNKSMLSGHCKAYRLRTSPNHFNPCDWNRNVYASIIGRYTDVSKLKGGKV